MRKGQKRPEPKAQVCIYFEVSLLKAVDETAFKENLTRSEWVRRAARRQLEASSRSSAK